MPITRPAPDEHIEYYGRYINLVTGNDLVQLLQDDRDKLLNFVQNIPPDKLDYRYAPGKWNIREVLVHMIDCERVFAYRALCFARKDENRLPGFDEEKWGAVMNAADRSITSILLEYNAVRNATIALFATFNHGEDLYRGIANNNEISVRALGYIICGHEIHHINVITERYLKK